LQSPRSGVDSPIENGILKTMEQLDDTTVEAFIDRFFGYGDWDAPVWFIGMEEGGGGSIPEVRRRIETWRARGSRELEDLVDYHFAIGVTKHVRARPALQPTWSKLVHLLLGMAGEVATDERIRTFQAKELGRKGGSSALLELLPLPSPGVGEWLYVGATTIPHLSSRERYRLHIVRHRIAAIREQVARHPPRVIVFLGMSYVPYWSEIAQVSLAPRPGDDFISVGVGQTTFVVVKHPTARGVTNALFRTIGEGLARHF
jgi:hypothetical protein